MVRSDLNGDLHRLANLIERYLGELFPQLLAESRLDHAQLIAYQGCDFIEQLRKASKEPCFDEEGGDE